MLHYNFIEEAKARTLYENFSEAEYESRYRRIREMMDRESIDCLVLFAAGKEMLQKNARYISGWADGIQQYVVFPREGEPTLFVSISPHALCCKLYSHLKDIRWSPSAADGVADRIIEAGGEKGMVGIVGRDQRIFSTLPCDHFERLKTRLPRARWSFVTGPYEKLRGIKSEEEISFYRKGAEITDKCMESLVKATRVGVAEYELYAEMTAESWRNNALPIFALLGSTPMADPTMPYPWRVPSARKIAMGDLILNELSMSYFGCSGQLIRPIAVGKPTERFQKMYAIAEETFQRVAEVLKPGCTREEVLRASSRISDAGLIIEAPLIHGWDDKPESPHWGIRGQPGGIDGEETIQENQLIMIEPNPCTPDYRAGIFLGDLGVIRRDGWHSLHKFPLQFVVVDG